MITGDSRETAMSIAKELTIINENDDPEKCVFTGTQFDKMTDAQKKAAVGGETGKVFSRVEPAHKRELVKHLIDMGQIVAMTGDGVNDAPALKQAHIGIAMGISGTEVAKSASDMILADDNFATIVYAVKQGRVVWDNLRKVLLVNTPINNSQGLSVLLGLLVQLPNSPISAIQILYSNFICAVTLGFVTAIEPAEDGIMSIPPRQVESVSLDVSSSFVLLLEHAS